MFKRISFQRKAIDRFIITHLSTFDIYNHPSGRDCTPGADRVRKDFVKDSGRALRRPAESLPRMVERHVASPGGLLLEASGRSRDES